MNGQLVEGYVDLQVNGYQGIDFNQPGRTVAELRFAAEAMQRDGVRKALPTLITGSIEDMCACIHGLRNAIETDELCHQLFAGIHLEGPFLSRKPGFIGAHPPQHALDTNLDALSKLVECGQGLVKLVTLAPEVDLEGRMTRFLVEQKVVVSAGHTDASLDAMDCCIEAGLSLFTHLCNACPPEMNRHDNIIYRALRRCDRLRYTLIADGFHVPKLLFENLLQWVPLERLAVVSDAISAAGLGPGVYRLAGREVAIGHDKAARDPSGKHFVGSACSMRDADRWLIDSIGLNETQRKALLATNPATWLGLH
ncbi:MAG: N-acetylglucosamine-6-phosphate deacetylase [Pirellulaceae bacterium]|nr:N-acetylglucosamine-6-phosphate deacetylase [Pirellulaceae bacterium]